MKKKVEYTDDRGELPERLLVVAEDVLPSPAEFARALDKEKVTINLSTSSLAKFRRVARKHHLSYQVLIREVLDRVATRLD
jgi:predicted DNA binding CopG/RHH family protein